MKNLTTGLIEADAGSGKIMKDLGDVAAGTGIAATFAGWLPDIAAGLAIIWTVIRIYEWARVRIFKQSADAETP